VRYEPGLRHQRDGVLDGLVLERAEQVPLHRPRVVGRVDEVDDLPRAQERRGEQGRVLAFFGHGGILSGEEGESQKFALCDVRA